MKRLLMLATATAAFTTFAPMASQAQIAVEVPGVGVRVGEEPRHRERDRDRVFHERDVRGGPDCKTVSVTEDTPSGTRTVTKKKCD